MLRFDRNYGYAEGYNRALAGLNAEYFVLLNSDVEVTEGWLDPLVRTLDGDGSVAAVSPKIRSFGEPDKFEYAGAAGGFIDFLGYPFCRGRILDSIAVSYTHLVNSTGSPTLRSANSPTTS